MQSSKVNDDRVIGEARKHNSFRSELWFLVLTFLPVKTLLVLRAVCKSFLTLIDNSDFVSSHLRRYSDNVLETKFLTVTHYNESIQYKVRKIKTFASSSESEIVDSFPSIWKYWYFVGTLDGLILLSTRPDDTGDPMAMLWNPSVRRQRRLSLPSKETTFFGLGYDSESDDYKVVALCLCRSKSWVYSVKTSSWKSLADGYCYTSACYPKYSKNMSIKNGVVWIEKTFYKRDEYKRRLVWFDFGTEKFRYGENVPCSFKDGHIVLVKLDGGSSVGVFAVDGEKQGSVWALETETMSWVRRCNIDGDLLTYGKAIDDVMLVERNGEFVWKYWAWDSRSLRDIEKRVVERYDSFEGFREGYMGVYVESLVLLNQLGNDKLSS